MSVTGFTGTVSALATIGVQALVVKPKRGFISTKQDKAGYSVADTNPSGLPFVPNVGGIGGAGFNAEAQIHHAVAPVLVIPQVTVEERHHDELEITEHPVQQGASIADHAFKRPSEITVKAMWSNSPNDTGLMSSAKQLASLAAALNPNINSALNIVEQVLGLVGVFNASTFGNNASNVKVVYDYLNQVQQSLDLMTLYTGKRRYDNMLLKSLIIETDKENENSLNLTMVWRQIFVVNVVVGGGASSNAADPVSNGPTSNGGAQNLKLQSI